MCKTNYILLAFTSIFVLLTSCASKKEVVGYAVKARIDNPENYSPYYLEYSDRGEVIVDTNYTVDGDWIVFKGKIDEPVVASFGVRGNPANSITDNINFPMEAPSLRFFLSNDKIEIVGDANHIYMANIKGGSANQDWSKIKMLENDLINQDWTLLKDAYHNLTSDSDSTVLSNAYRARRDKLKKTAALREEFIKKNPNSIVSSYFLSEMLFGKSLDELKNSYAQLGEENRSSRYGGVISDKIARIEANAIGIKAIPFRKTDMHGKPISLEDLKGNYVLLDFWGTQCGPCIQSFPHLKELYAKYKSKGFEIIGVADESWQKDEVKRHKRWKEVIEREGLTWIQVLNEKDKDQLDLQKAYEIAAFPTLILLDKEGKIAARFTGKSDELAIKLKEIFGS
ncbi:AhpC/TSA family protein [Sphingobacterium yanglingense]|uniref:Peroxiredoxin n=1 Tax=Sphingobacterium yanglingense TaxID=1437280 RepID=A0A4R6W8L6_9SPHI|nr:AhpC/TSA family protein [Sphingobacterium yanglingense]TDQ73722.1 peroxiredoxin [Sphingobacterium yanglingense]